MLLRTVVAQVARNGYTIGNVDATVVMERPEARAASATRIEDVLAAALGVEPGDVNVKATTGEGMGFVGRGEGVAALAVADAFPNVGGQTL